METETKQYELICILEPHLERADLDGFKKDVEKMLANNNGQLMHFTEPQKRDLAYPINKQNQGIYIVGHISLNPESVINFLKELKTNKQVLRHLISVLEIPGHEKPRVAKKPRIKKEIKESIGKPAFVPLSGTAADKDNKVKLEEIDKKLDELVGI